MRQKIKCYPKDVFTNLLGICDLKVYLPDGKYFCLIGRGSVKTVTKIKLFNSLCPTIVERQVLSIGRFCEFARCDVLIAGEHRHDRPINITFSSFPLLRHVSKSKNLDSAYSNFSPKGMTEIGDGVVLSLNSCILAGAAVGDGSVVGANSLVTKRFEEHFVILGGSPAKVLRHRKCDGKVKWWDWQTADIVKFLTSGVIPDTPRICSKKVRVVCSTKEKAGALEIQSVRGFEIDGRFIPSGDAPKRITEHFEQLKKGDPRKGSDLVDIELDPDLLSYWS